MPNSEHLSLQVNQALVVNADRVFVDSGIVWLTQSGLPDDVLLFAGQAFSTQRSGKVVIQALSEETKVSLQSDSVFSGVRQLILALSRAVSPVFRSGSGHRNDKVCGTAQ